MRRIFVFFGLLFSFAASLGTLAAARPQETLLPRRTEVSTVLARGRKLRVQNDMASAQKALSAAKLFLAKAVNDPAGHRMRAQQAVENALTEVKAALAAGAK